jgi:recombination protein RecA
MRWRGWLDQDVQSAWRVVEHSLMERDRTATLQRIIAAVQRRWGTRALRVFSQPDTDIIPVISTGFPDLDAALHIGGVPRGRLTELLGTPTSGMTTIALTLLARAQAQGDLVGYVDLSRTFDAEYAAAIGLDLGTLLVVRPPTAADALDLLFALISSGGVGVLVVDSLALFQLVSRDAAVLDQALRVLPGPLAASPCALIALTLLPYSPRMIHAISQGGSMIAHAAALRLHIARESWVEAQHGAPGCAARITVLKHRLAPPHGQAQVLIRFDAGRGA